MSVNELISLEDMKRIATNWTNRNNSDRYCSNEESEEYGYNTQVLHSAEINLSHEKNAKTESNQVIQPKTLDKIEIYRNSMKTV